MDLASTHAYLAIPTFFYRIRNRKVLCKFLKENDVGEKMTDLIIIGAGAAGLAAAIYGGTRGLSITIIESSKDRIGGTASGSPMLENVPGFPDGVSGRIWGARMHKQAEKFGAVCRCGVPVKNMTQTGSSCVVTLADETLMESRAVLIATGLAPRLLAVDGTSLAASEICYEPPFPLTSCRGKIVCVVGGSNAAGQTALAVSKQTGTMVHLVFTEPDLEKSMASYLVERILPRKNILLHPGAKIIARHRNKNHSIKLREQNGAENNLHVDELVALIGRNPDTKWLGAEFVTDTQGYIKTGHAQCGTPHDYPRFEMETSVRGVFAAGDIRSGSIKCVAVAQGEGVAAIEHIRAYLRSLG